MHKFSFKKGYKGGFLNMKKFLIGIVVLLAVLVAAVCTLDVGTGWITQKGAEYVANTYNLGVSIGGAKGNPVKGYTFTDIELTQDNNSLIKAGKIFVDPALLKIIRGNIALDWVELSDIKSTIPNLLKLAEVFTGQKVTLPAALPLKDLTLNTVGGKLDGTNAEAALDIVLNGLPLKGDFSVDMSSGVTLKKASLDVCDGTVTASGAVTPELDLTASVKKVQISGLGAIVPQISSFAAKGLVTADLTVKGALDNPAVNGTAEFSDGSVMGFPLAVKTTAAMQNMKISLNPLTISAIGIPTSGSVTADLNGKTPSVKVSMKTDGPVTAETLRKNLPTLPADLGGQVDGVNVAVEGPVNALQGTAQIKADKLTFGGQAITGTLLKAAFNSKGVVTMSGGSNIAGNPATLKGTVNAGGKEVTADVSLSIKDFDLAMLPKMIPSAPQNIKGKVNAALTVKGKGSAITAGGKLDSKRVSLNDMNIDNIVVPVTFSGNTLTFKDASLVFMELPVTKVNGSITLAGDNVAFKEMSAVISGGKFTMNSTLTLGKNLNGTYDLNATGIDLGTAMKTFGAGDLGASGKLSGSIKGTLSDTDITGDGSASIPLFTLTGLKFEQIKSSIKLSKMIASLPDFSCKFADGTVTGALTIDINKMDYSLNAAMKDSQLKNIIDQVMPTLGGGLTGKLTGDYKASGKLSPFSLDGSGTVSSAGGELYGFSQYKDIINIVSQLHGNKKISYANAKIPFTTSATELTLQDGSVINANKGDGIYQYIKGKGTFAYSGALNIDAAASVNTMLVDTAASALSGAVTTGGAAAMLTGGIGGIAGVVTGAITGATKSYGKADFRELTFHIGGTADSPSINNFKVNGAKWTGPSAASQDQSSKTQNVKDQLNQKVNNAVNKLTEQLTGSQSTQVQSNTTNSSSSQAASDDTTDAKKQLEDSINQAIGKGLKDLLGK
jgi:hypothetical protein